MLISAVTLSSFVNGFQDDTMVSFPDHCRKSSYATPAIPSGAMLAGFLAVTVNNWFPLLFGGLVAEALTLAIFISMPKFRRA